MLYSCDDIPDHPDIRNMEMWGTLDPDGDEDPVCPICNSECEYMYTDENNEVLGCDCCVRKNEPDIRFYPRHMARMGRMEG